MSSFKKTKNFKPINNEDLLLKQSILIKQQREKLLQKYTQNDVTQNDVTQNNVTQNKKTEYLNNETEADNIIYQLINGGLGNQLFMIFNIISLSYEFNKKFNIIQDETYQKKYLETKNTFRKTFFDYNIFSKLQNSYNMNLNYETYQEKEFSYNKIYLEKNKNYKINGYFQSYKYFFNNVDHIKRYLTIDNKLLDGIRTYYSNFKKKIICIHIRLGDYLKLSDYHAILPLKYYEKCLSYYNLEEYQIILFTDDIKNVTEYIKPLNINFICADDYNKEDETQFFMLSLADVLIGANSTFSLMSVYLNEMYSWKTDSIYHFPYEWFGKKGPNYNIDDLIPFNNLKFNIYQTKKCAVIFFHKNIQKLYKQKWIDKCVNSILEQEKVDFDIFEINYGNEDYSIFENIKLDKKFNYLFFKKDYSTHFQAATFLLNKLFNDLDYDFVFNTNLDDYYDTKRFYFQYMDLIINNSKLNSTLWNYITENNNENDVLANIGNTFIYNEKKQDFIWKLNPTIRECYYDINIPYDSIRNSLLKLNNCICHPGVCFTKDFWNSFDQYGNKLRYRNDKPYEDLSFWLRAVNNNIKITIVNKNLVNYRLHKSQIGAKKINLDKLSDKEKDEFKENMDTRINREGIIIYLRYVIDFNLIHINKFDHYFLYVKDSIYDKLKKYIKKLNIDNYHIVTFNDKININQENINEEDIDQIIQLFDVNIDINCDKIDKFLTSKKLYIF